MDRSLSIKPPLPNVNFSPKKESSNICSHVSFPNSETTSIVQESEAKKYTGMGGEELN